jgi:tetratricopeptide (TPR) repeat protein
MQFFKEGNFAKAVEFFEAAIQNNDTEGIYHARLAASLIQARKSATRAIDAAQRAIDLEPYNLEYKFNLAMVFEAIGSKSNAKKIYEEILRWEPGNARATMALNALKKNKGGFGFGFGAGAGGAKAQQGESFFQRLFGRLKK